MHIFFIRFTIHLIVNAFCRFCPFFLCGKWQEQNRNKAFSLCFSHISALSKAVLLGANRNAFRHQ